MKQYEYYGPVYEFNTCINECWSGTTRAVSERKARSNLIYQYKKSHNRTADSRIRLPGLLVVVDEMEAKD